jgi:paraquat-inducible protein B
LKTGNLLTGKQLINFDYHPTDDPGEIGRFEQYVTLPTIETGVGRLEAQVSEFLAKLNALPLDDTVSGANKVLGSLDVTLAKLTTTLASVNKIAASEGTQALPDDLGATLAELRSVLDGFSQDAELYQSLNSSMESLSVTLDNISRLSRELRDKPNSVLFPVKHEPDPIPEARP